jgi:hypothetical protein
VTVGALSPEGAKMAPFLWVVVAPPVFAFIFNDQDSVVAEFADEVGIEAVG